MDEPRASASPYHRVPYPDPAPAHYRNSSPTPPHPWATPGVRRAAAVLGAILTAAGAGVVCAALPGGDPPPRPGATAAAAPAAPGRTAVAMPGGFRGAEAVLPRPAPPATLLPRPAPTGERVPRSVRRDRPRERRGEREVTARARPPASEPVRPRPPRRSPALRAEPRPPLPKAPICERMEEWRRPYCYAYLRRLQGGS
ncbi:hypothetical protein [Bailinhaonella thermotolerans]|uniref:Uncharacterized protein n=1 Tax=Bailinhaonella thermotolerans TaxID=1070861 RepID=A0A3A4AYA1_9ACTN|nr:hypothetical protein [Bailinhaonella thermotolerans]RJL26578.1 hypothetical protein D5H75_26735 [Bailinhaonella thermotolerans]